MKSKMSPFWAAWAICLGLEGDKERIHSLGGYIWQEFGPDFPGNAEEMASAALDGLEVE